MVNRFKSILFFIFAFIALFTLLVFDFYAKPQSDDWGWLEFIKEYGYFGSYLNIRETFQASPYMLLVMFPVVSLQQYISYGLLLFIIQISLPILMFVLISRFTGVQNRLEQLKLFFSINTITILIYLTAWNTNTHQNAIFWLTGLLAYVFPISLFFGLVDRILKIEKTGFDRFLIFLLTFLLVGVQINYIIVFGLIGISLVWHKKIPIDSFFRWFVFWVVFSAVYTWSYSGWLNRVQISNKLDLSDKLTNFIYLPFIGILKEPIWSLSLFLLGLYAGSLLGKNILIKGLNKIDRLVILKTLILIMISSLLILIAFHGGMGYGRVQFITHFMVVLFLLALIVKICKMFKFYSLISLGFLVLSIGLFFLPLKSKLWRAQRFSNAWIERENIIEAQKRKGHNCVFVNELPKSDILGHSDLNNTVNCDSFIGCVGDLEYAKIKFYDNWVHKQHYNLKGNIIIRDEER